MAWKKGLLGTQALATRRFQHSFGFDRGFSRVQFYGKVAEQCLKASILISAG